MDAKTASVARRPQARALVQATVLAGALIAIAAAMWHARSRPFDPGTLKIQIDALRSQSAEMEAVAAQAGDGTLAPRWSSNHLEQLRAQLRDTRESLEGRPVPADLAMQHAGALHAADVIEARLVRLQHRPPTP